MIYGIKIFFKSYLYGYLRKHNKLNLTRLLACFKKYLLFQIKFYYFLFNKNL
jgi:hypothetical protein